MAWRVAWQSCGKRLSSARVVHCARFSLPAASLLSPGSLPLRFLGVVGRGEKWGPLAGTSRFISTSSENEDEARSSLHCDVNTVAFTPLQLCTQLPQVGGAGTISNYAPRKLRWGQTSCVHCVYRPRYSKNIETGLSGGCGSNRLAHKPHPLQEDQRFRVRNRINTVSFAQLAYARFSVMNMQLSSVVSKIQWPFPTPSRIFHSLR